MNSKICLRHAAKFYAVIQLVSLMKLRYFNRLCALQIVTEPFCDCTIVNGTATQVVVLLSHLARVVLLDRKCIFRIFGRKEPFNCDGGIEIFVYEYRY